MQGNFYLSEGYMFQCVKYDRYPKFILESTSARPRLEITNSMSLLPFLFLFIVALYRYIFYSYSRTAGGALIFFCYLFQMISANAFYLYSGMEGGSLHPCLFKRLSSSMTACQTISLTKKTFSSLLLPLCYNFIKALGYSLIQ